MTEKQPQPGWYDDPKMVNTRRYWDGEKWTEHRQEKPPPTPSHAPESDDDANDYSAWITWGYVCAVFLPPVGLVIGISRIGAEPKWAWKTIGLSLAVMLVGIVVYLVRNP